MALYQIIKNHTSITYNDLWDAYKQTDKKPDGTVWDIYSDIPNGTAPYQFTFDVDKCGNYHAEGDCYNREHSVPQSWFGEQMPMKSDLFHLYPTDGWVNNKRGNLPYGEVNNASWTSQNGSKVGTCGTSGYSNTVFEPIDAYKGDLARSYFYMCTRYMDKDFDQTSPSMFTDGNLKPWVIAMLIRWHNDDPVSQKEKDRNNAIYNIQHNRNPFIDYPELVGKIFGTDSVNAFHYGSNIAENIMPQIAVFPNPAHDVIHIQYEGASQSEMALYDVMGKQVLSVQTENTNFEDDITINVSSLSSGLYILKITDNQQFIISGKIIIQ
ncbi:MAG: endonuclease [Bacteroidales bacterium]|nr:endonuclease [Bacteroidales bacterium]